MGGAKLFPWRLSGGLGGGLSGSERGSQRAARTGRVDAVMAGLLKKVRRVEVTDRVGTVGVEAAREALIPRVVAGTGVCLAGPWGTGALSSGMVSLAAPLGEAEAAPHQRR